MVITQKATDELLSQMTLLTGIKKKKKRFLYSIFYGILWFIHTVLPPVHRLSTRPSVVSCNRWQHTHYSWVDFYILHEMGVQTEHHLSSTQTAHYQQKQTKNCVTPLMWATDAKPLVSQWSCLYSAIAIAFFGSSFSYLYEMETIYFFFTYNRKSDDETSKGIWFSCSCKTGDPLNFMNKWMN